jgi:hypothetical protein
MGRAKIFCSRRSFCGHEMPTRLEGWAISEVLCKNLAQLIVSSKDTKLRILSVLIASTISLQTSDLRTPPDKDRMRCSETNELSFRGLWRIHSPLSIWCLSMKVIYHEIRLIFHRVTCVFMLSRFTCFVHLSFFYYAQSRVESGLSRVKHVSAVPSGTSCL